MIKNIVFDIGNVCVDFCYKEFFAGFGFSEEVTERICRATAENELWDLGDIGRVSEDELLGLFIAQDPGIERELRKVYENFSGIIRERAETIPWIEELHAKGYKTYYLSNYPSKVARECADQMKFLKYMDGGILSYKIGMIKPDADIYRKFLSDYNLKSEECLFIDDRAVNCEAAVREGFAVIQFTTYEEVRGKMEEMLCYR
ncbi:MAG: HAD family phosphatase [Lachnospiraceae bacterium]|nr:HAD family phosphatase [Lachnospiraceae bacterium]